MTVYRFWFKVLVASNPNNPFRQPNDPPNREVLIPFPDLPVFRELARKYGYKPTPYNPDVQETWEASLITRGLNTPEGVARDVAFLRQNIVDQNPPYYRWYSLNELIPVILPQYA